jgi:hypothetical protein
VRAPFTKPKIVVLLLKSEPYIIKENVVDIEYHQTARYHTGAGSLLETISGGVTAKCGEALASAKLLGASEANLAFCRAFLTIRTIFIKNTYGGMFLLAGVPEWTEELATPFFDPDCHSLLHGHIKDKPTAEWMEAWLKTAFKNKQVKVAILSYGNHKLHSATMRDNDEFTVIAGEADETKITTK